MEKFSIKRNILKFCNVQGIKKSTIAEKIKVSASNFAGSNIDCGLNSDAVVNFLREYPQISAEWLMRGEGEMLRNQPSETVSPAESEAQSSPIIESSLTIAIAAKDETIAALKENIATQEKLIAVLTEQLSK